MADRSLVLKPLVLMVLACCVAPVVAAAAYIVSIGL
jgi:hypothetical protein